MKTAVEWYIEAVDKLNERCLNGSLSWFQFSDEKKKLDEQAKQMEKEQIMDAYNQGCNDYDELGYKRIEEYYNEIYKNTNE